MALKQQEKENAFPWQKEELPFVRPVKVPPFRNRIIKMMRATMIIVSSIVGLFIWQYYSLGLGNNYPVAFNLQPIKTAHINIVPAELPEREIDLNVVPPYSQEIQQSNEQESERPLQGHSSPVNTLAVQEPLFPSPPPPPVQDLSPKFSLVGLALGADGKVATITINAPLAIATNWSNSTISKDVREGDVVLDKYRVTKITSEYVQMIDTKNGKPLRVD